MQINIITCKRDNGINYLPATLDSLFRSDWKHTNLPINLIMGSQDETFVEEYKKDSRFIIVPWTGEVPRIHVAFVLNYIRALRNGDNDCCIFEDDIEFSKNWFARTLLAIEEMNKVINRYVLALYTARNLGADSFNRGKWYRSYFAPWFYGTQGVYFPEIVRKPLADYMFEHQEEKPGDLLINEWSNINNCLYCTQGSLVQHIGRQSSGLGHFHQAWNLQ